VNPWLWERERRGSHSKVNPGLRERERRGGKYDRRGRCYHGGDKGDTKGIHHRGTPLSGAKVRKMSVDPSFALLKEENEPKLKKCCK
jgi:hypothetical protein